MNKIKQKTKGTEMNTEKPSLLKKIITRLILEAIIGIVLLAKYPLWNELISDFKGDNESEEN